LTCVVTPLGPRSLTPEASNSRAATHPAGAIAEGNGYCGTMAMALVALKGLLPNLSGLILRSAEREAGWRATNDEGVGEVGRRKSDHQLAAVRR